MKKDDVVLELAKRYNKREELIETLLMINERENIRGIESRGLIEAYYKDKTKHAVISNN